MSLKRLKKTYFLIFIALLFVVSAYSSLMVLNKSQKLLEWNERATGWALVQLVILQQSYVNTLRQYQRGDDVHEQLLNYYDLTWSAYKTLIDGSDAFSFSAQEDKIDTLKVHFKIFEASDPLKVRLSKALIDTILEGNKKSHLYAMQLLNYEFQGFSKQRHNRDSVLVRLNQITVISLLGLCLSGALFLSIILRDRRRMTYMAYHDSLTQLNNRSALKEKMTQLQLDKVVFATLLIDVDGFKLVNDKYGHDIGDQLLVYLTRKMSAICKGNDFVGRLGGDEFAIVCFSLTTIDKTLKNLLAITRHAILIEGCTCQVGLSIGVSFSHPSHETWVDLLKDADDAMYQAKQKGGNQYQVYQAQNKEGSQ